MFNSAISLIPMIPGVIHSYYIDKRSIHKWEMPTSAKISC